MNFAIILHGLVHRSLPLVASSFNDNLLNPLQPLGSTDVYFHSWDTDRLDNPRTGENDVRIEPGSIDRFLGMAQGRLESRSAFDATIDWQPLLERNPMRHCTDSEAAARVTLMNYVRSLESLRRAWEIYLERREVRHDWIIVTRADLRFLHPVFLPTLDAGFCPPPGRADSAPQDSTLWVPAFQDWGGFNDRFAIGREREMATYSRRFDFALQWIREGKGGNPQRILKHYLESKAISTQQIDLAFQRVRATGEIAGFDRELSPADIPAPEPASSTKKQHRTHIPESFGDAMGKTPPQTRDRFIVLAREAGPAAGKLARMLAYWGKAEIVIDRVEDPPPCPAPSSHEPEIVWIPDAEARGFEGLMSDSGPFPAVTAWSRALAHLNRTLSDGESVWFVEDDVAGDTESFDCLIRQTQASLPDLAATTIRRQQEDPDWPYWGYCEEFFDHHVRAFQPLCRLSSRLIRKALDFRAQHGRFTFHEVLFPSVALEHSMSLFCWEDHPSLKPLLHSFQYRPLVSSISRGISHPVKDSSTLSAICDLPSPKMTVSGCVS